MNSFMNGLRRAFSVAAMGAALLVCAGGAAYANAPAASPTIEINAPASHARIVRVERNRAATAYEQRYGRVSEDGFEWAPMAYRDIVRVIVEVQDRMPSRADGEAGVQRITFELDPAQLSPEQNAALSQRRMSARIAAFQLNVSTIAATAQRIDYSRSNLCGGDSFRCEESFAYYDAPVERMRLSVG